MKLFKLGLASILAAGALFAGSYNVDSVHSNVSFKVRHMMISNVKGEFTKFSGDFSYDEKTKKLLTFNGNVKVSSIDTDNEKRDKHLKSADFFDAEKFPNIKFELKKIVGEEAYANLTIHGITKEIVFDYEDNGSIKDPWGNTRIGLAFYGKISRKAYGLKWNDLLEAGGAVVGDTIKLDVEIEGILAK